MPSGQCFNLPGRFGFGRTFMRGFLQEGDIAVSICQADLGLAELDVQLAGHAKQQVSICQADLGLAELRSITARLFPALSFQSARQIWVWPNLFRLVPGGVP